MIQIKTGLIQIHRALAGLGLLLAVIGPVSAAAQNSTLMTIPLRAGMHNIQAEVAQTPEQREIGLMNRKSLPGNAGMLFVFEQKDGYCFWMKNTFVPLSIAFIGDDGTIVNIEDMAPQTETSHCAHSPVRYALEKSQGWFTKRGFKAGMKLGGRPFDAAP
jgi:uncharacterized membrane protein (UPF0127 family)